MFKNPGEKIKIIAVVLFWITVVASVILAFVFGWSEHWSQYVGGYKEFEPVYFFTFLIGCPVASYISTLFLVSFGVLVQNTQHIKEMTEKIDKNNVQ